MISSPEEKILYTDIQKKLFYIIPEKWECIYLYASVIDRPKQKPIGEMFFYYLPKGIIKKKYVNGYEIPNLFNIDDEQYSTLITDVYNSIKLLRETFRNKKRKLWSSINIFIENNQFKIEYSYEDLKKSPFDSYERHVIWRYNYLNEDVQNMSRKDKKIIEAYREYIDVQLPVKKSTHIEGMYNLPIKNIIEFERALTVEEAIAQSKKEDEFENRIKNNYDVNESKGFFKKRKKNVDELWDDEEDDELDDDDDTPFTNQILKMKK